MMLPRGSSGALYGARQCYELIIDCILVDMSNRHFVLDELEKRDEGVARFVRTEPAKALCRAFDQRRSASLGKHKDLRPILLRIRSRSAADQGKLDDVGHELSLPVCSRRAGRAAWPTTTLNRFGIG